MTACPDEEDDASAAAASSGEAVGNTTSTDEDPDAGETGDPGTETGEPPSTSEGTTGPSSDSTGPEPSDTGDATTGDVSEDVPLQLLAVHGGRFMRSCDQGSTWSEPWEEDPAADCFHDPDSLYARPVYGHGVFVAPSGWGDPGALYVSEDALTWERLPGAEIPGLRDEVSVNSAGAFFDGERIAVMRWLVSADGAQWSMSEQDLRPPGIGNVRRVAYSTELGLLVVKGNDSDLFVSTDWAETWSEPDVSGDACPTSIQHRGEIVIGHDRIVLGAGDGTCFSSDQGVSWTQVPTDNSVSDLIVTPEGFVSLLSDGTVQHSPDAQAWETIGTLPFDPDTSAGALGGAPDVLVAIATTQEGASSMLRSTDGGATWQETQAGPETQCPRINLETFMVPPSVCGM